MRFKQMLVFACMGWSLTVSAQDSLRTNKWKFFSAKITGTYIHYFEKQVQPASLIELAPELEGLKPYQQLFIDEGVMPDSSHYLAGCLGTEFFREKHPRIHYNASVQYEVRALDGLIFVTQSNTPFDTLTASNGDVLYLDSVKTQTNSFSWHQQMLSLQLGQSFYPSGKKGSSFYIGYLITIGRSMNSDVQGVYNTTATKLVTLFPAPSLPQQGGHDYDVAYTSVRVESVNTAPVMLYRLSVPIGASIKGNFAKMPGELGFNYQCSPGIELLKVPGSYREMRPFLGFSFGMIYVFGKRKTPGAAVAL